MAVVITINTAHPTFAAMDAEHLKKVRFTIGAVAQSPMFYNFKRSGEVGEATNNNKILEVSTKYPLVWETADFVLMGAQDPYHASRTISMIIDLMRKNYIIFTKDGVVQTPEQVLAFTASP
jgi:hypothetical protein